MLFLLICQLYGPRSKVLFKSMRLRRSWNRDHVLGDDPCQRDLSQCAPFTLRNLLDLFDYLLVVVEVLALEFGNYGAMLAGHSCLAGYEMWVAYPCGGSHQEQNLLGSGTGSRRRASRGLADYMLHRQC